MKNMKKIHVMLAYKGLILGWVFLFTNVLLAQGVDLSKKYEWNYAVEDDATVSLINYDCDITIETSSSEEVRFEIEIDAESDKQEDINILNSYLENLSYSSRSDLVKLETSFWEKQNSNTSFGKSVIKMKLKNGKSIRLSEFKIKANLYMPATAQLELNSKYSKIQLENVQNLKLNSYDDDIIGENVEQEVNIKAKYSDMEFGEFGSTELDLYECNFTAEKTKNLEIKSKYSDVKINYTGSIDIVGYEDKMTFQSTGNITINTKYSDLKSNTSGNLIMNIYDSDIEIEEIGNLTIKESKYSEYKFKNAGVVNISTAYDDYYYIDDLVSLETTNSKYSEYIFKNLKSSFEILEGYDDKVRIYRTSTSFTHLDINSKYGSIILNIDEDLPLRIDWKTKYGKIDFNESKFTTKIKISENSEFEYRGVKGGPESEHMPFVKVRGYDIKMNLNE